MSDMIRGKELAQAVLDLVTAHPEKHRQESWVTGGDVEDYSNPKVDHCGTQACLAGWAVLLNTPEGIRDAEAARVAVAKELDIPFAYRTWDRVALKLLFPDLDLRNFDPDGWDEDEEGWNRPERRTLRAFYQTWDHQDAIERFAAAFDLEVPTHE